MSVPSCSFNGAADFHRRKLKWVLEELQKGNPLQWGRRLSSAEMSVILADVLRDKPASMGPPTFIGGNRILADRPELSPSIASMGPPTFIGGNNLRADEVAEIRRLQWGRRLSSAEIWNSSKRRSPSMALQWGRRLSSAEMSRKNRISCGRFVKLQWGRRLSSAEITMAWETRPEWLSFNGAADFHRRKCGQGHVQGQCGRASMGPPTFIGGNIEVAGTGHANLGLLQWGRRLSSAEISYLIANGAEGLAASMGPPTFIGGNAQEVRD